MASLILVAFQIEFDADERGLREKLHDAFRLARFNDWVVALLVRDHDNSLQSECFTDRKTA
jgi:hypothetical protein